MGLKQDLKTLNTFSDNPFDAKYRPEKEMKKLYILLLVTLPILLGFCCQFYILIAGPLSIYWIITYFHAKGYWKDLGWKAWKYHVPIAAVVLFGLYLAYTQYLVKGIGYIISTYIFYY